MQMTVAGYIKHRNRSVTSTHLTNNNECSEKTMQEMKKTTNQEMARQQAQFQQFLENSKEKIIEAVRTP